MLGEPALEGGARGGGASNQARDSCLHCAQPVLGRADGYCCAGCRTVAALLRAQGFERYYDLRSGIGTPVQLTAGRDLKWLEQLEQNRGERVVLDVQGMHCAACVWLIEQLFRRRGGPGTIVINPALGRAELCIPRDFDLRGFVTEVEQFGYLFGPPLKQRNRQRDDLLLRTAVCLALAGNAMMLAVATYLGLEDGALFDVVQQLGFALSIVATLVGGPLFFRSAWQALRRRMLHLDLPIALGIVLAFAGGSYSFLRFGRAAYFDSLTVFIALMVLGRWLQERAIDRNRHQLLASDGTDGLLTRRMTGASVELVPCRDIEPGDRLLLAPGDLVPVSGVLLDSDAQVSFDWINGESRPRTLREGAAVAPGSFNSGTGAMRVSATEAFEASTLPALLTVKAAPDEQLAASKWWQQVSGYYVLAVLAAAAAAFVGWFLSTGDLPRALEVTTSVLIVTCPCAIGIATPLAYEFVHAGLRRAGLFVRNPGFLDRALSVRRVVFDKTGTLTTGSLKLANPGALAALGAHERAVLYNLCSRSSHPKSLAILRALVSQTVAGAFTEALSVRERAGAGLETFVGGAWHRLGSPAWLAVANTGAADLAYTVDGQCRALFETTEEMRPDAQAQVSALAEAHEVWILSGDLPTHVARMADDLGLPADRGLGGQSPHDKAAWLREHDQGDTLMVGDGLNDGPAVDEAWCSGTPAVDRPFMAARTDFFFVTSGLGPISLALRAAHALARTVRRNLVYALTYNGVAVALAWAGLMPPWLAAVLMPLSSVLVLVLTSASLSIRSRLWTS